jgi:outer membrane autotransporter protein
MNSFLSLVTNPFGDNRGFAPVSSQPPQRLAVYEAPIYKAAVYKAPVYKAPVAAADLRRWSIWAAAYGAHNNTAGDPVTAGSHDRSTRALGYATGLDYRVTPDTTIGFALGGGGTRFDISGGFGGGHSDMFQAAVYGATRIHAAYVSVAVAYAWHNVTTDRFLTVLGTDHLTADFRAQNIGGRIEGGYRFAIPGVNGWYGFGVTPYAAWQTQVFQTPFYQEIAASGSAVFALAYDARTTTTTRTELGAWLDRSTALKDGATLTLRTRAAWAHDTWSDPSVTAAFRALPGSSFVEFGAAPARDSLLASATAEITFRNRISLAGKFDTEIANRSQTYSGTARLRYTW